MHDERENACSLLNVVLRVRMDIWSITLKYYFVDALPWLVVKSIGGSACKSYVYCMRGHVSVRGQSPCRPSCFTTSSVGHRRDLRWSGAGVAHISEIKRPVLAIRRCCVLYGVKCLHSQSGRCRASEASRSLAPEIPPCHVLECLRHTATV